VSSNATIDGGAAYGVKDKVYASDKSNQTSNTAYIGTHLLDVDLVAVGARDITSAPDAKVKNGQVFKKYLPKVTTPGQ
jgi:hypothetical protein